MNCKIKLKEGFFFAFYKKVNTQIGHLSKLLFGFNALEVKRENNSSQRCEIKIKLRNI